MDTQIWSLEDVVCLWHCMNATKSPFESQWSLHWIQLSNDVFNNKHSAIECENKWKSMTAHLATWTEEDEELFVNLQKLHKYECENYHMSDEENDNRIKPFTGFIIKEYFYGKTVDNIRKKRIRRNESGAPKVKKLKWTADEIQELMAIGFNEYSRKYPKKSKNACRKIFYKHKDKKL